MPRVEIEIIEPTNDRHDFGITTPYGAQAERTFKAFFRQWWPLGKTRVEIKHKSYVDSKFYVETHQHPRAQRDERESGISITEAEVWGYCIGNIDSNTHILVAAPTEVWLEAMRGAESRRLNQGSHPTRAKLVTFEELIAAAIRLDDLHKKDMLDF